MDREPPTKRLTKKPHKLFKGPYIRVAKKIHEISHDGSLIYFEARVLGAVEQYTWGWNKKSDRIAYSQIEGYCGLTHANTVFGIHNLEAKGIIRVIRTRNPDGGNDPNAVKIRPDYRRWRLDRTSDQYRNHLAKNRSRYRLSIPNKRRLAIIENDGEGLEITKASIEGSIMKKPLFSKTSPRQAIPNEGGSIMKKIHNTHPTQEKKEREEESSSLVENSPPDNVESKPSFSSPSQDQEPEPDPLLLELEPILSGGDGSTELCRFAIDYVISEGTASVRIVATVRDILARFADPGDEWGQKQVSQYRQDLKAMIHNEMAGNKDLSYEQAKKQIFKYYALGGKLPEIEK